MDGQPFGSDLDLQLDLQTGLVLQPYGSGLGLQPYGSGLGLQPIGSGFGLQPFGFCSI